MSTSRYVPLAPEVDEFRKQFEQVAADMCALVNPLTDEQFCWKPAPDRWSIEECVEHLNATARAYLPTIDRGIAETIGRNLYSGGPFRYNPVGRLFVWLLEPPPRVRAKAPAAFAPGPRRSRAEVMAGFRAYQVQYVDRLRQASGLHLSKGRVRSPVAWWIRIPLGSAFAGMLAHERRHLWQARQVALSPDFPRLTTTDHPR